ncbi:hypothetical protein THTE_2901 [Thermogutta terrifontis]|uniref:Uncharacterized protein n=1 Tax=Thermogutta terrifontis TaxID=1331910 RepID=A0A286RHS0_9BACT|nr:hypothetical protein THTE_2901 [Thermogutta terrifontis]
MFTSSRREVYCHAGVLRALIQHAGFDITTRSTLLELYALDHDLSNKCRANFNFLSCWSVFLAI